jgi:chorismate dehydratase
MGACFSFGFGTGLRDHSSGKSRNDAMAQFSSGRLRLGRIGFLNVLPIYYPLESGIISHPFVIVSDSPACLNELMAAGRLDLSVVSSIEYARHPERYYILPDLSISCCGAVKSVLLLSQVPVDRLKGKTILVTRESHTSVALLKILFSEHLRVEADLEPGCLREAAAGGNLPVAFLAIGDEALRLSAGDLYPYRLDLGEAWHSWTRLPFVFALWVIQRESAERLNGALRTTMEVLAAAKHWGRNHLDHICAVAEERGIVGIEALQVYYRCLGYDLRQGEQEGLNLFYSLLRNAGDIPRVPNLEVPAPLARVA